MKLFDIDLSVMVTILEGDGFTVEAETKEEAIKIAKSSFETILSEKYPWCDYDNGDITINDVTEVK